MYISDIMSKIDSLEVLGLKQFAVDKTQFYANTMSNHLHTSHMHINKPHKHNFYATFLFTRGTGYHEIDFNSYEVTPYTVFVLSPGQTHSWQLSEDVEGIIFFHSQEFYEAHYLRELLSDYPFFSNSYSQPAIYLDQNKTNEIETIFDKILSVNRQEFPKKKQLLLSLITQVYIELEQFIMPNNTAVGTEHTGYYLKFLKFQQLVEEHFVVEKSVAHYAQLLNMTSKHLNRINKLILNKTTSEIITDRVILEAKRLLIFGEKNFAQISDELGFSEYAHFSKLFKAKTGQTPSQFSASYS